MSELELQPSQSRTSQPSRCRAIEIAEHYADGLAGEDDLRRAHALACRSAGNVRSQRMRGRGAHPAREAADRLLFAAHTAHPTKPFSRYGGLSGWGTTPRCGRWAQRTSATPSASRPVGAD